MANSRIYSKQIEKRFYQTLFWANVHYQYIFCFKNNQYPNGFKNSIYVSNTKPKNLSLSQLKDFKTNSFNAIYLGYDFKNQIEDLSSKNSSLFEFEDCGMIEAEFKFDFSSSHINISSPYKKTEAIWEEIVNTKQESLGFQQANFIPQTSKKTYLDTISTIKENLLEGDIYEICYCMEFIDANYKLDNTANLFKQLCVNSPKPFASYIKIKDQYLISASPERFIKKTGDQIFSQPIKGTIKRSEEESRDLELRNELTQNKKDQAENLMIVDLVRNDLSKICKTGSVKVDELFGVYTYPTVHQMISSISGQLKNNTTLGDIIAALFPMGSMTGAPKIKAMQLIDQYETFKRGLYSGTIGQFTETGFDFNVVIRSLQYNAKTNTLGYHVGSAITYDSVAESEYEECILKSKVLTDCFC